MASNKIEPTIILTIATNNILNIPIIITDSLGEVLTATNILKLGNKHRTVRKLLLDRVKSLIEEYGVDTILLEQNQLFIDKIERYPDPYVLRNVQLGYSIKTMIEDNFWEAIPYILEIPRWEWKKEVLNSKVDYAIDLYKSHILLRGNLTEETLEDYDENNYYEALCLSESMLHSKFLNKKYQINRD